MAEQEAGKIDIRVYVGILLFRWKLIAVCFLWCLLVGVLYLDFAPKKYMTDCKVMIYRDPMLEISKQSSSLKAITMHAQMMKNEQLRDHVVKLLMDDWATKISKVKNMYLDVDLRPERGMHSALSISVLSPNRAYGHTFLTTLISEHQKRWDRMQKESSRSASTMLETELIRLENKIMEAEDAVIAYRKTHEIAYMEEGALSESRYLAALMERRNQITTELILLEAEYPLLKDAGAGVISQIGALTRETGEVKGAVDRREYDKDSEESSGLPSVLSDKSRPESKELQGWRDYTVNLIKLQKKEKELASNLRAEHPELKALREEIADIQSRLESEAAIQLGTLMDRRKALISHLKALEKAEYQWHNKNQEASLRQAELKRKEDVLVRYEDNYKTLYGRLHDMRVSEELKAEHFQFIQAVQTNPDSVWPDVMKVLIAALGLGLASGFGLALLSQVFDNRIQSIADVEQEIGIPFLGGIPCWAHSGLEKSVRPVVTEEHSVGAIEAYRALRTNLLAGLAKVHEKILFVSSADSGEGKTLTSLNISIMTAQMGKKVLLIDLDLRRGRLHRSLGVERSPGMTEVLGESKTFEDAIITTQYESLDFIPSGGTVDDAAELLQSSDMGELLGRVQDRYDYIIVDTSPILRVTDTVIVASQDVGAIMFVTNVIKTPKPLLRYALDMLKDANLLGLVLNNIELHKITSLYYAYQYPNYAYYSNAYAYGYDSYYYDDRDGQRKPQQRRRGGAVHTKMRKFHEWFRRTFLPMG